MDTKISISVVVPVYKAEDCLHELYKRLVVSLEVITGDFEIILVEDCGGDRSWDVIEELAEKDARVIGIQFSRNFGQHHAITAGIDKCKGDWVVVMDCDLQDQPEEIPRLYEKAQKGYHVVCARRGIRKDSFFKRISSQFFYNLFNYLADTDYDGQIANYRIVSRQVVDNFKQMGEQLRFFPVMINWLGYPTTSIDVVHAKRFAGKSAYSYYKLMNLALNIIIAYSYKPLRLMIKFGFAMALFSFAFGISILFKKISDGTEVLGWSSLIVSLYFIGGIIIAILGIIGVYLGRTFEEIKKRPLYIIRRFAQKEKKPDNY